MPCPLPTSLYHAQLGCPFLRLPALTGWAVMIPPRWGCFQFPETYLGHDPPLLVFQERRYCTAQDSSCWRFLAHRASAAFLAISFRRSGDSFSARALPPLRPPSLPSSTAAGFFSSAMQQSQPERSSTTKPKKPPLSIRVRALMTPWTFRRSRESSRAVPPARTATFPRSSIGIGRTS
jgi:hypothetical protein